MEELYLSTARAQGIERWGCCCRSTHKQRATVAGTDRTQVGEVGGADGAAAEEGDMGERVEVPQGDGLGLAGLQLNLGKTL